MSVQPAAPRHYALRERGGAALLYPAPDRVVIVGYYLNRLALPAGAKYALLVAACLPVILALYELVVRRFGALRYLFGMKPRR
jgi:hypothetical protein